MLFTSLLGALIVMVIGYSAITQNQIRVDRAKKIENRKLSLIVNEIDQLLLRTNIIPFSKTLLICLQNRKLTALQGLLKINKKNHALMQQIENCAAQIEKTKQSNNDTEQRNLIAPHQSNEQAKNTLKLIKRLREIIKIEHKFGRISTSEFSQENQRLIQSQTIININNIYEHTKKLIENNQLQNAKQLLKKGVNIISKHEFEYAKKMTEQMLSDLDEINKKQNKDTEKAKEADEIDELFQPKRKW